MPSNLGVLAASSSAMWDTLLGPAFSRLSPEALGHAHSPDELRQALLGSQGVNKDSAKER
eukprot:5316320-Amphidinium_carterae.1